MAVKQTAGRNQLGVVAPKFAELNDDVLFGEVWSREDKLSLKMRSIVTVVTLVAKGMVDSSFEYHMATAKQNGVTRDEMAEILTHEAFYAGWPNAWAAFRVLLTVYGNEADDGQGESFSPMFGKGSPNDAYAQYFIGQSFLNPLTNPAACGMALSNVTFEPGCRTFWHKHTGGQILLVLAGEGLYQERGKPARRIKKGDVVQIAPDVEHWHGACDKYPMTHISVETNVPNNKAIWLEAVSESDYAEANKA